MEPGIELCDEQAINMFLGKCTHTDSFKICPSDPIVVEHLESVHGDDHHHSETIHATETHTGCYKGKHGQLMCKSDLGRAFEHGSCFKVDHRFVCEEDLDHIKETECADIGNYAVCGLDMYNLFHGEPVKMSDGHDLIAEFPTAEHDPHSGLCRKHQDIEFCLENILDLYKAPHDCVMFSGEWLCQDEMVHAWKTGCVSIANHDVCGNDMVDAVLQSCVDIDHDWICPTAVGTRSTNYHNSSAN